MAGYPDRGGNRQLNRALHIIAITRGRIDPETRAYLARKEAEGKSRIEAIRCLKRHLARHYHRILCTSSPDTNPPGFISGGALSRLACPT
jgi:transposase